MDDMTTRPSDRATTLTTPEALDKLTDAAFAFAGEHGRAVLDARAHLAARIAELEAELAAVRAALDTSRDYVASALAHEREAFKGYEHCSDIKCIEADLAAIDAAMLTSPDSGKEES